MTTTANYILTATVGGQDFIFEYEDAMDVWHVLEEFYTEDYAEVLIELEGSETFPVEVKAMHNGKVITTYRLQFNGCVFDHFFAKGWKADCDPYTLNEFVKDIKMSEEKPKHISHDVTCYWMYMWNKWTEEECKIAFGNTDYRHFWNKWCECWDRMGGPHGSAEIFYAELTDHNRDRIVRRAIEVYENEKN